jgi:hypothetical protein
MLLIFIRIQLAGRRLFLDSEGSGMYRRQVELDTGQWARSTSFSGLNYYILWPSS